MAELIYVKFESPALTGPTSDPGHEGELGVLTWSLGHPVPDGRGERRPSPQSASFSRYVDRDVSPQITQACWNAKPFGKLTVRFFRSREARGGPLEEYLRVILEHVMISNYEIVSGPAGDVPVESVTLEYGTIQYDYRERRP